MSENLQAEPVTVWSETLERNVCGLCGSADIEAGYGLAGGGGCGMYNFCNRCQRVLDKSPDPEASPHEVAARDHLKAYSQEHPHHDQP